MNRPILLGLAFLALAALVSAQSPDFAGSYSGDGATMELRPAPFGFEGVLRTGQESMPLQGKLFNGRLSGTVARDNQHTLFEASLDGGRLRIVYGSTTLTLVRASGAAEATHQVAGAGSHRSGPPPSVSTGGASPMRFRRVSVEDRQVIRGEAVSFLVPVGWRVEGGIVWRLHPALPAGAQLRVTDPSSLQQLETFPSFPFTWGDNCGPGRLMPTGSLWFGNEVHPPFRAAGECLETTIIPRVRGALRWRVTQRESLPKLAAAQQQNSPREAGGRVVFDAARVRIEYDAGAGPVEEDFFAVMQTAHVPAGNIVIQIVDRVLAMRAERGRLDGARPVHLAIVNSSKINLEWFNRYVQIVAAIVRAKLQEIHAVGEFSRALAQTSQQISDERMHQWQDTNRSQDRIDREWSEYVRGTETYDDPVRGEPVELPSSHDHAWVSRGGEYILSDNPNFNPNVEASGDWVEMKPSG
jgi:hypothetical protein